MISNLCNNLVKQKKKEENSETVKHWSYPLKGKNLFGFS